ncbi:MAG: acetate/propionate family kinase [Phycisphaerae bacterium]
MKILVSNIGSTSFKFRLFELGDDERELARGSADRIGGEGGEFELTVGSESGTQPASFADHGRAIIFTLDALTEAGALTGRGELDAVAFKAVMGGDCEPVCMVTDDVLERMEYFVPVAPAHNPPYIEAMRMFRDVLDDTPLVAAFEPGFHRTNPPRRRHYAVPLEWAEEFGIKRYGFHGASHRYIATRTAELMPNASRVISCHLGGSSSICAIRGGESVATSMGLSPQSGLPQGSRVGDLDPYALALLQDQAEMGLRETLSVLGSEAGLAGVSGRGGDWRDIASAAKDGDERAKLAVDMFVTSIRDYVGAYLMELGGADAVVFTGGIGEHNPPVRSAVLAEAAFAGIRLDEQRNSAADGEARIDADDSTVAVWVIPTNEELIVARQARELLEE